LLLLQVLLSQVLEISLGNDAINDSDGKLGSLASDGHLLSKVSLLGVNLDVVLQELLEGSDVEDLILDRGSAVNDELDSRFLSLNLLNINDESW
jgi:hypothetical protein